MPHETPADEPVFDPDDADDDAPSRDEEDEACEAELAELDGLDALGLRFDNWELYVDVQDEDGLNLGRRRRPVEHPILGLPEADEDDEDDGDQHKDGQTGKDALRGKLARSEKHAR
jgi:hypothetical protein